MRQIAYNRAGFESSQTLVVIGEKNKSERPHQSIVDQSSRQIITIIYTDSQTLYATARLKRRLNYRAEDPSYSQLIINSLKSFTMVRSKCRLGPTQTKQQCKSKLKDFTQSSHKSVDITREGLHKSYNCNCASNPCQTV